MTLKLQITGTGPPGGWYYKDPETGREFRPVAWNDMLPAIKEHRRANNLPIPSMLREQVEDQVCKHVPPEWCGNVAVQGRVTPLTFAEVIQGTLLLSEVVARAIASKLFGTKSPFVEQITANDRTRVCAHCHYNTGIQGCSSCNLGKLYAIVTQIVGQRTTSGSEMLNACKICKCALKAKVWIDQAILQRHLSDDQNAAFPEWCWAKKNQS